MSALTCAPPFNSFFLFPFAQNTSFFHFISLFFHFVPCRFVLSDFFSFLFFSLFHKPLQTDNRLPVFFHGLLSKRACLLFPIFLSQPSLFFTCFPLHSLFHYSRRKSHCHNMSMKFLLKEISFQVVLVRPLVPWTRISSVYWHVIVTLPSRPLTLLEQRIQANWK